MGRHMLASDVNLPSVSSSGSGNTTPQDMAAGRQLRFLQMYGKNGTSPALPAPRHVATAPPASPAAVPSPVAAVGGHIAIYGGDILKQIYIA